MKAPERIWADPPSLFDGVDLWHEKQEGAELTAVEYIRKDASDTAIAAARADGVREGMLKAAEFCHWNAVGLNPRLGYQVDAWTEEQGGKHPGHAYAKALRAAAEAQP